MSDVSELTPGVDLEDLPGVTVFMPSPDDTYSKEDAAKYLKTTVRHIYDLTSKKEISFSKVAGQLVFRRRDLVAYLDSRRTRSNAELAAEVARTRSRRKP